MKKIFIISLLLLSFILIPINNVSAKSIADYRKDLESLKKEKENNDKQQAATQEEILKTNKDIAEASEKLKVAQQGEEAMQQEIVKLELDISEKQEEIKDLIVFKQKSSSENFYLKYIFGAENFTDLIYRISVIQQLTNKNDQIVDNMNELVAENNTKTKELEKQQAELKELSKTLQTKVANLGKNLTVYAEDAIGIDDQIKSLQELIDSYVKDGCSENEDVATCSNGVPYDNGFNKPLKTGVVTDEFGMRWHPTKGIYTLHTGMDLGGNREGTPVLAPASAKVVAIYWKTSCGGTQLVLNHMINGKAYTTQYMHLLAVSVSVGDVVTKGQQIALVGGGSSTSSYDSCSTGAHLHFMIATGHYMGSNREYSYSSVSTYYSKLLNPRDIIWFPKYGVWW